MPDCLLSNQRKNHFVSEGTKFSAICMWYIGQYIMASFGAAADKYLVVMLLQCYKLCIVYIPILAVRIYCQVLSYCSTFIKVVSKILSCNY